MKCWAIHVAYRRFTNRIPPPKRLKCEEPNNLLIQKSWWLPGKVWKKSKSFPQWNQEYPICQLQFFCPARTFPMLQKFACFWGWLDTPHVNVRKPSFKKKSLLMNLGTKSPPKRHNHGRIFPSPGNSGRQNRLKPQYLRLEKGHAPVHRANLEDSAGWRMFFVWLAAMKVYIYTPGPPPMNIV